MKSRYYMKAKTGEYVEHTDRKVLEILRFHTPLFKYARISKGLQSWPDVIKLGTIYPATVESRAEFRRFNATH